MAPEMRLIAVSRVLNEDDIIEAFLRHHAPLIDHHLLLDNGSTDRTIEILRSLKQEGIRITVLQNRSPAFGEYQYNTALFTLAARNLAADWVLFLDCDEFLDERRVAGGLRARLAETNPNDTCLHLPMVAYHPMPQDDPAEPIVPRRIRKREVKFADLCKLCMRGALAAHGVRIGAGNHAAVLQGRILAARIAADLPLAHYDRRSAWQALTKAVIGRLKTLTGGRVTKQDGINAHYTSTFESLRDNPESLLLDPGFLSYSPPSDSVVDDPIAYAGAALRYTVPTDPMMKAVSVIAAYAEALAQQQGRLIDADGCVPVRTLVEQWAAQWTQLL